MAPLNTPLRDTHFCPKNSASKRCSRCWQAIADSHTPASGRNAEIRATENALTTVNYHIARKIKSTKCHHYYLNMYKLQNLGKSCLIFIKIY